MVKSVDEIIEGMNDPQQLTDFASMAENAEDFDTMRKAMKKCVELVASNDKWAITDSQRSLLSVAYKNLTASYRQATRSLNSSINGEEPIIKDPSDNVKWCQKEYMVFLNAQLSEKCNEVINLLKNNLIDNEFISSKKSEIENEKKRDEDFPKNVDSNLKQKVENQVFIQKMIGDYYRYLAELKLEGELEGHKAECKENYTSANDLAEWLPATHPTRLGLSLNFSVAKYEILGEKADACRLAKKAFDEAIQKLDLLDQNSYKDSTLIMQLLRDNLTLWSGEENEGTENDA